MAKLTITLNDDVLARARAEADRAGKSLSRYVADLIAAEEERRLSERAAALEDFFRVARAVKLDGAAYKFNRDEIYDEALS